MKPTFEYQLWLYFKDKGGWKAWGFYETMQEAWDAMDEVSGVDDYNLLEVKSVH